MSSSSDSAAAAAATPAEEQQQRVLFPLWAKLGLFFGLLVGLSYAALGLHDFRQDLERERREQKQKLTALAETLALGIDGDLHQALRRSADEERPEYQELVRWLSRVIAVNRLIWAGTLSREGSDHWFYVVDAGKMPVPPGYPIFDISAGHLAALQGRAEFVADLQDEWGSWDAAFAPIRNDAGEVVALIELDADADARRLFKAVRARSLTLRIVFVMLWAFAGSVLAAQFLNRHLRKLTRSARELRAGGYGQDVDIRSLDEIGLLGRTFNSMVHGLREREFIRETFGRYVTEEVVTQLLADPQSLRLGGERKKVTVLMTDLRGFYGLSEQLGPEQMVALLNRYFTRMAEAVMAHRGMIAEFTGDGIVALFGAPTTYPDDALRAVACSVAMQQELHRFNLAEHKELEMGIGIATGMVVAGNIGSEKRMKYGVVGEAINLAARLESFTVGSQVLIGEATYLEVADQVQVGEQLELRAKGKREPVRCYSLQGVFGPFCLQLPEKQQEIGVSLELPALCFRITGKQVEVEPLPATATLLTRHTLWLRTGWPVEPLGNLKLHLELGDGRIADDIYGKVTSVESPSGTGESAGEAGAAYRVELRFTSLPEREREMLLGMLEQA